MIHWAMTMEKIAVFDGKQKVTERSWEIEMDIGFSITETSRANAMLLTLQ